MITENATRGLWMLLAATSVLLLIACTNVANLLLARAVVRERDLAIRASLGAGRRRLFGQVMGETIALGVCGSVIGIGLAWGLLRIFVSLAPVNFPRLSAIALDAGVLGFALVVAVFAGLIAGLAPAVHLVRSDLNSVIRSGGSRGATAGRARRASRLLVVSEVALALALVTTAGLMVKSLLNLQGQDLGVTREPILTFGVGVPPFVADGNDAVRRFQSDFLERVRSVPGVTHASAINMLPIANTEFNGPVRRLDQTGDNEGVPVTEHRTVMDRYFETMGVTVLAGRAIHARDRANTPMVAVINETLARRLFPTLDSRQAVTNATRQSGLLSWLSVLFGVLAASLAILGIYSVMSYTVAQRERELAIRAAVGARRSSLLSMVLREGLMLSAAGIAAGAGLAYIASGVLRSLLYNVSATDPMVFAGSAAGLAAVAVGGYLLPAARASKVEPVVALRSE